MPRVIGLEGKKFYKIGAKMKSGQQTPTSPDDKRQVLEQRHKFSSNGV